MDMTHIEDDLQKKRSQVDKARLALEAKKKKNQRRRAKREKCTSLIEKSRKKIKEYEYLIEFHEKAIDDWKTDLNNIPEDEEFPEQEAKYDKVRTEYEKMEVLATQITDMMDRILDPDEDEILKDSFKAALARYKKEFKSAKGHGF